MHTLKVNIRESSVTISIKFDHGRKIVFNILIAFIKTVINEKNMWLKSAVIFECKKNKYVVCPKNESFVYIALYGNFTTTEVYTVNFVMRKKQKKERLKIDYSANCRSRHECHFTMKNKSYS